MNSYNCSYQDCRSDPVYACVHDGQPPVYLCDQHLKMHISASKEGHKIENLLFSKVSEEKSQIIEKFFSISEKELKLTIEKATKISTEVINQVKADLSLIIDRSSEIKSVNKSLFQKLMDYSLGQGKTDLSSNLKRIFEVPDIENYLKKNQIFHYYSINTKVSQFEEKWKSQLKAEPDSPARSNPEETTNKDISSKYESLKKMYWTIYNDLQIKESTYMHDCAQNEVKIKKIEQIIKEKEEIIQALLKEKAELTRSIGEIFEENSEINRKKDENFKSELAVIKFKLEELITRKSDDKDLIAKIDRVFNKAINHEVMEDKNLKQKIDDNKGSKQNADLKVQEKKVKKIIDGDNIPMKRVRPDEEEQKYSHIPKKGEKNQFKSDDGFLVHDLPEIIPKKHQKQ